MCWCGTMQLVIWPRYIFQKLRNGQTLYSRFFKLQFLLEVESLEQKQFNKYSKHVAFLVLSQERLTCKDQKISENFFARGDGTVCICMLLICNNVLCN